MRVPADENVPEEHVRALRGAGHAVAYSREVAELGVGASDEAVVRHGEREGWAVVSTDAKDLSRVDANVPILVAPQGITGGAVRRSVARLETLDFDPATGGPIWLSTLDE